ncbi:MAG: rod shape-determining protein MreD [Xanthomonadales bacterium]
MIASRDRYPMILATLALAAVLMIVPLPSWLQSAWPYWVALTLIYWSLETQDRITLGLGFTVGLVLDLLTGSLLGLHALSLVIVIYLVNRFRARLRFFPPWQQALSVFAILMNDRIILLWVISLRGDALPSLDFWLPPLVGTLVWPWLFVVLDRFRGSMRLRATR